MLSPGPRVRRGAFWLPAAAGLLLTACSPAAQPTYGPVPTGPTAVATQQSVATLGARSVGRLGQVLVNPAGSTVYANASEQSPGAGCDAVCRRTWPLLLAPPTGVTGATGSVVGTLIGTVEVAGQRALTYAGHVLHVYVGDQGPGAASGQNVQNVWAAVTVSGAPAVGVP